MRWRNRLADRVLWGLMLAIAGCAAHPPNPTLSCHLRGEAVGAPRPAIAPVMPKSPSFSGTSGDSAAARSLRELISRNLLERAAVKRILPDDGAPGPKSVQPPFQPYEILALSAGGQYGAYGSGFLKGWSERPNSVPNRADIDMVTGVSTGAMMATHAYLGSSADARTRAKFDDVLKDQYTTLNDESVFRKRFWFELPFVYSVYDTAPLHKKIAELVDEDLLDAVVAEAETSRRLLLVGAVDVYSGEFEYFDLGAIARDKTHDRLACYRAAILASSAIPLAFNPVFVNDRMYVDGGARKHAFFIESVRDTLGDRPASLYGILQGDLAVPRVDAVNGLLDLAIRTSSIATDQLLLDSAYYVDTEARRRNMTAGWTAALQTGCQVRANDDQFDPVVGRCLWNAGYRRGLQAVQWRPLEAWTRPSP